MKKHYVLLTLLCCFSIAVQAQSKSGKLGVHVEAGYAFDLFINSYPDYHHHAFNIAVSPGYHVTEKLFLGAGVALYDYRYTKKQTTKYNPDLKISSSFIAVPVYAHGMWKFGTDAKPGLFLSLKAGYGIISKTTDPVEGNDTPHRPIRDYSGGLYLSPSIGFMYPMNNKHALTVSVSYDHQSYTNTIKGNEKGINDNKTNSTIAVKAGWAF